MTTVFLAHDVLLSSEKRDLASHRLSVCNVGGSGSHRLEILETNCTDN